jgi:hypothetical protein
MSAFRHSSPLFRSLMAVIMIAMVALQSAPQPAASLTLPSLTASSSVTGGRQATIKITLAQPALPGGALVLMYTSNASLVPVPPTVVVPGGATSYSFKVTTGTTITTTTVTIKASIGVSTPSAKIIVKEPVLSSLSVQSVYRAGGSGKITARLSGPAPSGGITIKLTSSRPGILPVPASIKIPAGYQNGTITVYPAMVATEVSVTLTASYDGRTVTRTTIVRNMS